MGREHVEFIQVQRLDWRPSIWPHLAGTDCKILSRDTTNGAASALVRYPPGWAAGADGWLDADEEFLVLDGALRLSGIEYLQDSYAFLPAGTARGASGSPGGAVVLTFFDREPHRHEGPAPARPADAPPAIDKIDAFEMPWECDRMDPLYAGAGLRWKLLRGHPDESVCTMLLMSPPHLHPPTWSGPQERHECVEEMFLISGDFQSNVGLMQTGAYFWRPPGVAHGPYGTRGGNLSLIRTIGAPLRNNWTDQQVEISRDPPYRPFLATGQHERFAAEWRVPNY